MAHRHRDDDPCDGKVGDNGEYDVEQLEFDRVGVNHQCGGVEAHNAEDLLRQSESDAEQKTYAEADHGHQSALADEDAADECRLCSQRAEGGDVIALVDDDHHQRTHNRE